MFKAVLVPPVARQWAESGQNCLLFNSKGMLRVGRYEGKRQMGDLSFRAFGGCADNPGVIWEHVIPLLQWPGLMVALHAESIWLPFACWPTWQVAGDWRPCRPPFRPLDSYKSGESPKVLFLPGKIGEGFRVERWAWKQPA